MVLKEILTYIHKEKCVKVDDISRGLNVPRGIVEHAIEELKDMGYLIAVTHLREENSCSLCSLKSTCNIKTGEIIKSYMLTKKGKKLLEASFRMRSSGTKR